jgi:hypothetical protein
METEWERERFLSGRSGHQERDDTDHQSLQETHPHRAIPQLQI